MKRRSIRKSPTSKEVSDFGIYVPDIGYRVSNYLLRASATFTAQATVQPTIGLLPIPRKPIIST